MPPDSFDVFLSYSSKDKEVVWQIAEKLQCDGIRVWLDKWQIRPGDNIPAKIEEGLGCARLLVLFISANAIGSDWATMESGTYRFRDPLNRERRFVPVRLDATTVPGSLAQFLHLDWQEQDAYAKLLEISRAAEDDFSPLQLAEDSKGLRRKFAVGRLRNNALAFSSDGQQLLCGSDSTIASLLDVGNGRVSLELAGHAHWISSVAIGGDGRHALSGSWDRSVRLWDLESGRCLRVMEGHSASIVALALSPEGSRGASCSMDGTIRIWEIESGLCIRVIQEEVGLLSGVALGANGIFVISSSGRSIRWWETESGHCLWVLEDHSALVTCIALSRDNRFLVSGSADKTLRLWSLSERRCLRVLQGHTDEIRSVVFSYDGSHVLSGSKDKAIRLWNVYSGHCVAGVEGLSAEVVRVAFSHSETVAIFFSGDHTVGEWEIPSPRERPLDNGVSDAQIQYANAKVVLVGDSGVGKTGLANYLALNKRDEERNPSTDGAWATHWNISHPKKTENVSREIWLWDFAGQVDYRLVHQLYLGDAAAAILVFNPQSENALEGLSQWERDLQKAAHRPLAKLLCAGRIDVGGIPGSHSSINEFMVRRGFLPPLHFTSARNGQGCKELKDAVVSAIDWSALPITTSLRLYRRMKDEIMSLRESGVVLIRLPELKQRLDILLRDQRFTSDELQTALAHLAGPGIVQQLHFGGFILLRPEILSRYAAALVRQVRNHPKEMGCISERDLLAGLLDFQGFQRLPFEDEQVILRALHETLVSRAWCIRQPSEEESLLSFPCYFRRERRDELRDHNVSHSYVFYGTVDEIYSTLVVRLHHTKAFECSNFWKDAADFKARKKATLGLVLHREGDGCFRLDIWFDAEVSRNDRDDFKDYIHRHLLDRAEGVTELEGYSCGNSSCDVFGHTLFEPMKIERMLARGKTVIYCQECGKAINLHGEKGVRLTSMREAVLVMQAEGQERIDAQAKELILISHAMSIAQEAGQIFRPSDGPLDIGGEIEFSDDRGQPSGKRLYLLFKSGGSFRIERNREGVDILSIEGSRHYSTVEDHDSFQSLKVRSGRDEFYWQERKHVLNQLATAAAVMFVVRDPNGTIGWMNISPAIARAAKEEEMFQVVFAGEPFDALRVRQWRDRTLPRKESGN